MLPTFFFNGIHYHINWLAGFLNHQLCISQVWITNRCWTSLPQRNDSGDRLVRDLQVGVGPRDESDRCWRKVDLFISEQLGCFLVSLFCCMCFFFLAVLVCWKKPFSKKNLRPESLWKVDQQQKSALKESMKFEIALRLPMGFQFSNWNFHTLFVCLAPEKRLDS